MKKILFFVCFLPLFTFAQALNGTYQIGTGQASPFNNLQNAIARLNTNGVNGPVVFKLLNNESYTATLQINSFAGSSTTNTVTIEPAENKNVTISVNNPNGYTGVAAVIKINGGDNIIINGNNSNNQNSRNLTLQNNNAVNYLSQTVFWIASNGTNAATNITIKNTILKNTNRNQDGLWLSGVFSGGNASTDNGTISNSMATANNTNTQISNNEFINIRQGVHVNSNTNSTRITNLTITNNKLITTVDSQKPDMGFYINNVSNFRIDDNIIDGLRHINSGSTNMYGMNIINGLTYSISGNQILNFSHPANNMIGAAMYIQGTSTSNATITRNVIRNIKNSGGGIVRGIDINISSSTNTNTVISNNFISDVATNGTTTNNANGIYVRSGRDIKLYHNTIVMNTNQNNASAALRIDAGSQFSVVNNILGNTSTTGTRYAIYSAVTSSAFTTIDYNNYYSAQHIGYLGSNRTTLANWKTATSKDTNSLNLIPNFVSVTDLHLTEENPDLDNKGTFLSSITIDIDLETRSITTPDIGADEFMAQKCGTTTVWNGSSWNNGIPDENVKAILNGNYNTAFNGNLIACELLISENVEAIIAESNYFKIETNLTVHGNLTILDSGSLVQVEDDSQSVGEILVYRNTTPMKTLDYSYWSSPVDGWKLNQLSPNTNPSRYHSYNPALGSWTTLSGGNHVMQAGKGYIVRAPNGWSLTNATQGVYEGHFIGTANNGNVKVDATKGVKTNNLLGNPYPSAIDIDKFILDPVNKDIFDGTIYLWTHNTALSNSIPGNQAYNYTADDYASYNLTGGVKTSRSAITGAVAPTGKIASGQAFFINVKNNLANGTYQAQFNNSMRVVEQNDQFFRNSSPSTSSESNEKNRLWLNISNENGAYHETLLGYLNDATNELDYGFDGKHTNGGNFVSIYSILDENKLSIQGRALPFEETEIIPIGFISTISGIMSIAIEQVDGFFGEQNVYLFDKTTELYHDLKVAPFSFEATPGTFDDRFELRFTNETLSVENPALAENNLHVIKSNKTIEVKSPSNTIKAISVFDITGKQVAFYEDINQNEFSSNQLNISNQVVIVKIKLENNEIVTKKLVF